MLIKKKNGTLEKFSPEKILKRIKTAAKGLKVSAEDIALEVYSNMYDEISSTELDELAARLAANSSSIHPDYAKLGGKLLISRLHKEVGTNNPALNYELDYNFNYFAVMNLMNSYLQKVEGKVIETPQDMYWRLANHLGKDINEKWEFYTLFSNQKIAPASPLLFNGGTSNSSMISCTLIHLQEDSLDGLHNTYKEASEYSKDGSGIGIYLGTLRSTKSRVANRGYAAGIVKAVKTVEALMQQFNQNGSRAGSCAIYLDIWHHDVRDFLRLGLPTGDEKMRARDIFTAVNAYDNFWRAVENRGDYYLFCPYEFKKVLGVDLTKLDNAEFEEWYNKGVEAGIGTKVEAMELYTLILDALAETGMPYVLNIDTVNRTSPHRVYGKLKQSNLCIEIVEYTDEENTAMCCLSSMILKNYVKNNKFDYQELFEASKVCCRMLNRVLDTNKYSNEKARRTALKQRAIAIGIQGLADVFFKLKISFESEEAKKMTDLIMSTIREAAELESERLYKEEGLKADMFERANSLLVGLMPTAGTALINGCYESFEPQHSNIFLRKMMNGEFVISNEYLIKELEDLGLWNEDIRLEISKTGSVQGLDLPEDIKNRYKTIFEIKQKVLIDLAAIREKYLDQSQSLNLYLEAPSKNTLGAMLLYSWKQGLKTGIYYLKSKPAWTDFTKKLKQFEKKRPADSRVECFGCS